MSNAVRLARPTPYICTARQLAFVFRVKSVDLNK